MRVQTFRLNAGTDVGCVRTNNEDNFVVCPDLTKADWFVPSDAITPVNLGEYGCILAVADGMGGENAGEVASAITIDTLQTAYTKNDLRKIINSEKSIENFMRGIVTDADVAIKKHVKEEPQTEGMGTTLIYIWILGSIAYCVWCGDSRAYIYNPDAGLRRFSKDHSFVQDLVDAGKLDAELAFDHPNSNIITRCLGDIKSKANPDFIKYNLAPGDWILLCSDGLCGLCRDDEILQVLRENEDNIESCRKELIRHALQAGGHDNCTVALFEVVSMVEDGGNVVTKANPVKTSSNPFFSTLNCDDVLPNGDKSEQDEEKLSSNTAPIYEGSIDNKIKSRFRLGIILSVLALLAAIIILFLK